MKTNSGTVIRYSPSPVSSMRTSPPSIPSLALNEYCTNVARSLPGTSTPRNVVLSVFSSLPVGSGGEEVAVFWTKNAANSTSTHAYVMIHGKIRNGNEYWTTMDDALNSAIKDKYAGASADDIVTAPQFFSTKYNSGQYSDEQLAFGDTNGWQAGDPATHPTGTKLTSIDALDAFVDVSWRKMPR